MTWFTRCGLALCIALVLHPGRSMLCAQEVPQTTFDGASAPARDIQVPDVAFDVYVPKTCAALEASGALLFLQPGGNSNYGTRVNPFPFLSPHWSNQEVRPGFTPAFNVGIRQTFDAGASLQLDWTHLNAYDRGSAVVTGVPYTLGQIEGPSNIQALGPPFLIGPPVPWASAFAIAHFDYDAINLQSDLAFNIGPRVQVRPFVGIQGTRIAETLTSTFQSVDRALTSTYVTRSTFGGAGPRLGMGLHYIAGALDLVGAVGGCTVIGSRQSNMDFFANTPMTRAAGLAPNVQSLLSPSSTRVIPCIDAKLGGSYAIPLGSVSILKLEAGYQAAVYINAINQYALTEVEDKLTSTKPNTPELTGSAVFLRTAAEYQSDFFVHGPYLRLAFQY